MVNLNDPLVVRDVLLDGLVQLLENQHLTPLMGQLLKQMQPPPNVQPLEGWVPDVNAWILATHNLRRTLMSLRLVDLGDQGIEEVNYEPILRAGSDEHESTDS